MDTSAPRAILVGTVALMFLFVIGNYFLTQNISVESIDTSNQPTIGSSNALVHVISIEEPSCPNCKSYHRDIFPGLKKNFIETGKIEYTTMIVSFSPGSFPAAEALLCAFYQEKQSPDDSLFYDFLRKIYEDDTVSSSQVLDEILLETARAANPNINIQKLRQCMEKQVYYTQVMRNTEMAKRLMGDNETTPALFVNGVRVAGTSEAELSAAIESALNPEQTIEKKQ